MPHTFPKFSQKIVGDFKVMANFPFAAHEPYTGDGKIRILRLCPRANYMHQHIFFELVYVLQGSATRRIEEALIPVSAGDYYVTDPFSAHCYEDTRDFEILSCLFLPEYIDRALADCPSISSLLSNRTLRFGIPVDLPIADRAFHDTDGSVKRIIKHMEREHTDQRTGYMELLRCYLTQVLVCAARACETRVPHEAVTTVMEYLKSNYMQPLSLQTLSQLAGYTPQYLSSLFSEELGMSIQIFLQQLRIEEACKLLSRTKLSMADVAAAVGYQDSRHFSKVFRRYRNLSPREYRKNTTLEK